jgi:hypothetical protein
MVFCVAVCAFAVHAFVSVHECFVSVTLVFVLCYACLRICFVPPCGPFCGAFLTGRLQAVCFSFVFGVLFYLFYLTAYRNRV